MDDGLDDRRGDVAGAQDLLLSVPHLSIFNAWADEPWVNNGAAVRVSLVCFGIGAQAAELNVAGGALIPANLNDKQSEAGAGRMLGAISKSEAYEPPAFAPPLPSEHQQLKMASTRSERTDTVAAAYGWADYRADLPDEEILRHLLALNLERSGGT